MKGKLTKNVMSSHKPTKINWTIEKMCLFFSSLSHALVLNPVAGCCLYFSLPQMCKSPKLKVYYRYNFKGLWSDFFLKYKI